MTLPAWLREVRGGVEIAIYVRRGANASEVAGEPSGKMKLRIHAPLVDGNAYAAVIANLVLRLGVAKSQIELISGDKNRRKRLGGLDVSAALALAKVIDSLIMKRWLHRGWMPKIT